ncbi:MAG: transposase [Phycisphaerales bacterium]|nr:MAG: transposase [Phycisphaerales bacterium]
MITSDDHEGLAAAGRAVFASMPRQCCQFHLQQNAQAYVPKKRRFAGKQYPNMNTRVTD